MSTFDVERLREIAAKVRQVAGAFNEDELHVDWKVWIALGPLFKEAYEAGAWQSEGSQIGDRLKRVLNAPGRDRQQFYVDGLLAPVWKQEAYFAVVGPLVDPFTPLNGEKENVEFEAGIAADAIEEEATRLEDIQAEHGFVRADFPKFIFAMSHEVANCRELAVEVNRAIADVKDKRSENQIAIDFCKGMKETEALKLLARIRKYERDKAKAAKATA